LPEILARRTPHAFDPRPIEAAKLRLLVEAFRWAPSSYNAQGWRIVVVQDAARRAELLGGLVASNRAWSANAPLLAVVGTEAPSSGEAGVPYHVYDCGQAVMSLVLQAEHMGLRCSQMAGWDATRVRASLAIPPACEIVVVIAIGYEAGAVDPLQQVRKASTRPRTRKPLDEIAFGDRWGDPLIVTEPDDRER
jgi:nitroreductase